MRKASNRGTMRLRAFVNDLIQTNGPMTTQAILDAYNDNYKHGTTMHILCNVLCKEAVKLDFIESIGHTRVRNVVWGPKEE